MVKCFIFSNFELMDQPTGFYQKNKNTIKVAASVILLYGILKMALRNYSLSESEWKAKIKSGEIKNPLAGKLTLTSAYGNRYGQFHNGADLVLRAGNSLGAPIYSPWNGKVAINAYNQIGGNQVIIDSGFAKFGFSHLKELSPLPVGSIVSKGQVIGKLGSTGISSGPHLHFTLRLGEVVVNPVLNMPGLANALK